MELVNQNLRLSGRESCALLVARRPPELAPTQPPKAVPFLTGANIAWPEKPFCFFNTFSWLGRQRGCFPAGRE